MTTKELLHKLVDDLSDAEAQHARFVVDDERSKPQSLAASLPALPDLSW